jgi:Ca2+-binding RTX toxin-like protein
VGETISGLAGNDTINGNGGNDILIGGLGADRLNGGDGIDTASYADAATGVSASLKTNKGSFGEALGDIFSGIENLTGSGFGDVLNGSAGVNVIRGGGGDDIIFGNGGLDQLFGDAGDDSFTFSGTQGFASIDGGSGFDTVKAGANNTKFALAAITGVELITSDGFANVSINGTSGNNFINLTGVTLVGIGAINGNNGLDDITGSDGGDTINGGGGNDNINGGAGNDIIRGGLGIDNLTGGAGVDTFVFGRGETGRTQPIGDTIRDFVSGTDIIDLSILDANSTNGSAINDAFTFIGTTAFSRTAGELRIEQIGALYYLQGDWNGDGYGDFAINLAGSPTVTATDFIL